MKKESDAYFTVEAAILYPIILSVILLMTYLLLFQYDRCLLEQDIGKATVLSGSKWTLTKEQLNDYMQKKALHFDEEKYIVWENEDPLWNLEKNDVILEKAGRLRYLLPVWERKKNIGVPKLLFKWIGFCRYFG